MRPKGILNFRWHVPQKLATGSKPSSIELADELSASGFRAIVSLEAIGDSVISYIRDSGLDHILIPIDDDEDRGFDPALLDDASWQTFCTFADKALWNGKPLFVHCSAGICRSVRLVERYMHDRCLSPP